MRTALIVVLALLLVGMLPMWPYAEPWGFGYFPSGILGLIVIVVLLMAVLNPRGRLQ